MLIYKCHLWHTLNLIRKLGEVVAGIGSAQSKLIKITFIIIAYKLSNELWQIQSPPSAYDRMLLPKFSSKYCSTIPIEGSQNTFYRYWRQTLRDPHSPVGK